MANPFVFGRSVQGEHFTDRVEISRRLENNLQHGINTILISPRRLGKTSLVKKVQAEIAKTETKTVFLDIFSCKTEKDFYLKFASAVIEQTQSRVEDWVRTAKEFLARLSPSVSVSVDSTTEFKLSLRLDESTLCPEDILNLPQRIAESKGFRIVILIDEFQQISEFTDSDVLQKRLRSIWQHQSAVTYCLFGSKQHLMHGLFDSPRCPFYKFGDMLFLKRIETPQWVAFLVSRFEATDKQLSEKQAEKIVDLTEGLSSYVQQLAWIVWYKTDTVVKDADIDSALEDLLDQTRGFFQGILDSLSLYQLNLLKAIATGNNMGLSSQATIERFNLKNSATVAVSTKALIKKDILSREDGRLIINDPILSHWVRAL